MKLIIDIPRHYYKLKVIENGSIACRQILKAVKNGIPYEERPHGKWMLSPNWSGYCCSNCGANPLDTNIDTTRVKSKDVLGACPFCRLCGAKMEADNEQ